MVENRPASEVILTRRSFLAVALGGSIAAGAAHLFGQPNQPASESTDVRSIAVRLMATATAVAQIGETSSFAEAGGFKKEFFESARRGTVLIEVVTKQGTRMGTGFFINQEGDDYYFITARHAFRTENDNLVQKISIRRAGLDNIPFEPMHFRYASSNIRDVVALKCRGPYPQSNVPLERLRVIDEFKPDVGDEELIVGFPYEFALPDKSGRYITLGSVLKVVQVDSAFNNPPTWSLSGIVDYGSSGSPVLIKDQMGLPAVVGIVYATNKAGNIIRCLSLNTKLLTDHLRG